MLATQTKTVLLPSVRHISQALSFALFALLLISAAAVHAAPLPDDPALSKPVTLAVKGEALSDVLGMMQDQTGVKLAAAKDVADQKATVFVDGKPLRDVMNGLATLFGYRWSQEGQSGGKSYRLWVDEKTRRDREDQRQKSIDIAWKNVSTELDYMIQFSQMSKADFSALYEKLTSIPLEELDTQDRLRYEAAQILRDGQGNRSLPIVKFYQTLPAQVVDAFNSGLEVYYDSSSAEPEWKLPDGVAKQVSSGAFDSMKFDGTTELDGVNLKLWAIITNEAASLQAAITARARTLASASAPSSICGSLGMSYPLAREKLEKAPSAQDNHLPHEAKGSPETMRVSLSAAEITSEAYMPSGVNVGLYANRSDILALLHKKLGLQIISDHYSEWSQWSPMQDRPLKEMLNEAGRVVTDKPKRSASPVDWGWDGRFCYVRAGDIIDSDVHETPNRLLRPWQSAFAKKGMLGIDELGQISLLTNEQNATIRSNARFLGLGDGVQTSAGLKLYGLLSDGQRKDAFLDGTEVARMAPEQRDTLAELASATQSLKPRVGIYRNGIRVDKPEQAPSGADEPVLVKMTLASDPGHFQYKTGTSVKTIEAATADEAWKKVLAETPGAQKGDLLCLQQTHFTVGLVPADGHVARMVTDFRSQVRYSDMEKAVLSGKQ